MDQQALLSKWRDLSDWLSYLMGEGCEGAVFMHVAAFPDAAAVLIDDARRSDSYLSRKLGATLAGYVPTPGSDQLLRLLDEERNRDQAVHADVMNRLGCQSVVEDVVFSATRWSWNEASRDEGLKVLRAVVSDTLRGQYWNSASYAMVGLCRYDGAESQTLLQQFRTFAHESRVDHPSNPSLTQEREFADSLAANNTVTLGVIDQLLRDKESAACQVRFEPDMHAEVSLLIAAAGGQYNVPPAQPKPKSKLATFVSSLFGRG